MKTKHKPLLLAISFAILSTLQPSVKVLGQAPPQFQMPPQIYVPLQTDTTHTLATYFTPATSAAKATNAKGFIQRWLVLEPIKKDIVRNNIFTDTYLRTTFSTDNFSSDFTIIPKDGEKVKMGNQELKWYALDSKLFNFKLFRFSYAINKPQYGVLFWVVTVVNAPEEIKNVRLAAGCNSAGMFWLNGQEALLLSGDRDMIVDNCTSKRLTLKKGRNIIRGAIINGPGMCDFSARFLDEKGQPIKNLTISYQ